MNAILYGLNEIHFRIPEEVLEIAFIDNTHRVNQVISIDERIMCKVIRPKVLIDCNIVGGIDLVVPFSPANVRRLEPTKFILEIPKSLTNGASIVSANTILSTNTMYANSYFSNNSNMWYDGFNNLTVSPMLTAGLKMMNALSDLNIVQTARLEVIGENTIIVEEPNFMITTGVLKCTVENSKNLENINPRSYLAFGDLVVACIKMYIFKHLRIKLDKGYVLGGHELSTVKETIDEYSDAAQIYADELKRWKKVAFFNNNISKSAFIKSMLPINS